MNLIINRNTKIESDMKSEPIKHAIKNLIRDINKACAPTDLKGSSICLVQSDSEEESFKLTADAKENKIYLFAGDDLGFVFGIYEISRAFLGIPAFWFWLDKKIEARESYEIKDAHVYKSSPFAVKLRGWFVNDEVLIHKWSVDGNKEYPWEMVFEALLRLGGNMIIPGTDKNGRIYRELASNMGLAITHHHAEPLGAEMFARAYSDLNASFAEYPEKFKSLWQQAIEEQSDKKTVFNLGFRGQGDRPFWEDDPRYQTSEERGKLMSDLIRMQYDMVKKELPNTSCCTNLYGETMELYRDGYLELPEDIIKIWADNGFGKMVSRRQENHNPRIVALPKERDNGQHGIYYHVSFYDLQAANHITMLPNSAEFVSRELSEIMNRGMNDYWIINCSNVKPHVYFLDFIANMWRDGNIDIESHRNEYVKTYYGNSNVNVIGKILADYSKYSVAYGEHEDEHAGEQFTNHVPRILISQYMINGDKPQEELKWATDAKNLDGQVKWFMEKCKIGIENYRAYLQECDNAKIETTHARQLFEDTIKLQVQIHHYCFEGAYLVCRSIMCAHSEDYKTAFFLAGQAREKYLAAVSAMYAREHGLWQGFYANECLTDIKQTAWVLESLMGYLRNLGEGPHFYKWQQEFLNSEEDRRVMLILNMENHLENIEMYELMKIKRE